MATLQDLLAAGQLQQSATAARKTKEDEFNAARNQEADAVRTAARIATELAAERNLEDKPYQREVNGSIWTIAPVVSLEGLMRDPQGRAVFKLYISEAPGQLLD